MAFEEIFLWNSLGCIGERKEEKRVPRFYTGKIGLLKMSTCSAGGSREFGNRATKVQMNALTPADYRFRSGAHSLSVVLVSADEVTATAERHGPSYSTQTSNNRMHCTRCEMGW